MPLNPDGPEDGPRHVVTITRRDGTVSTFTSTRRQASHPRKTTRLESDSLTGMPAPVSPEMFAALVAGLRAELAAARPIDRERLIRRTATPEAFTGRPWAWSVVTLAEAVPLTGRAKGTLRVYARPNETSPYTAAKGGRAFLDFPVAIAREDYGGAARSPARLWEVGALALWCAIQNEKMSRAAIAKAARNPLQQPRAPKEGAKAGPKRDGLWARSLPRRRIAAIAFMRALVREDTAVTLEHATARITAAGLDLAAIDVPSVLMEARRQETAAFTARLESESVHPEGLVTPEQVGAAFGVKGTKVWAAWRRGELVAAGHGKRGRPLFDPERLRARAIMTRYGWSRVPVDKDWTAPPGLLPPWLSDRSASPRPPGRDT